MPNSKRFKSHDLRLTRVSHLRRLISSVDIGHWPIFGVEHTLPAPAMAHSARRTQRPGQSTAAADHRVPERSDRNTAEEAGKDLYQLWSFCGEGARSVETDTD